MGAASHPSVAARWRCSNTIACSIITTRLDYCNSRNTSNRNLAKLQKMQNTLSRVVLQVPRLTHATPLMRSLHGLPVAQRVTLKLNVITYNVKKTSMPSYLSNLLNDRCISSWMSLRSSSQTFSKFVVVELIMAVVLPPKNWNKLRIDIQLSDTSSIFRKRLKKFLFETAFNDNNSI